MPIILTGSCNYERMGSDTLIRTYFLKEPIVHPILSHKVKQLFILVTNLKEGDGLQGGQVLSYQVLAKAKAGRRPAYAPQPGLEPGTP